MPEGMWGPSPKMQLFVMNGNCSFVWTNIKSLPSPLHYYFHQLLCPLSSSEAHDSHIHHLEPLLSHSDCPSDVNASALRSGASSQGSRRSAGFSETKTSLHASWSSGALMGLRLGVGIWNGGRGHQEFGRCARRSASLFNDGVSWQVSGRIARGPVDAWTTPPRV